MSVIISTPASLAVFTISDTTPDSPAAFPFLLSYLFVFVYWTRHAGNCICLGQTIPVSCKLCVQKLLMITFPSSFLFFIIYWQYTIISYAMVTNNILISFDHPPWNLKHITLLNLFLSAFYIWPGKRFSLLLDTSPYMCFPVFILSIVSAFH